MSRSLTLSASIEAITEGDYAESTNARWPEEFVAGCLADSLCLFVGLSMTDPNFIRWALSLFRW